MGRAMGKDQAMIHTPEFASAHEDPYEQRIGEIITARVFNLITLDEANTLFIQVLRAQERSLPIPDYHVMLINLRHPLPNNLDN